MAIPAVKVAMVDSSGIAALVVVALGGTSMYMSKRCTGELRRALGNGGVEIDLERVHGLPLTSVSNLLRGRADGAGCL